MFESSWSVANSYLKYATYIQIHQIGATSKQQCTTAEQFQNKNVNVQPLLDILLYMTNRMPKPKATTRTVSPQGHSADLRLSAPPAVGEEIELAELVPEGLWVVVSWTIVVVPVSVELGFGDSVAEVPLVSGVADPIEDVSVLFALVDVPEVVVELPGVLLDAGPTAWVAYRVTR